MYVSPKTLPLCIKSLSNVVSFNGNKIQIRFSLCISCVRKTTFPLFDTFIIAFMTVVLVDPGHLFFYKNPFQLRLMNYYFEFQKTKPHMQGTMAEFEKIYLKNLIDNMNFEYCVGIKQVFQIVKIFALNNEKIFRIFHQILDFLKWKQNCSCMEF